ncbi:MAG: YdeI/OmpD-associated family protein [Cytophagales bacterium]
MSQSETTEFCPKNPSDWQNWLIENHKNEKGVWLIIYKKGSPKQNITWSEAVDEALCFGWIDSIKKPIDEEKYKHYYGPRKEKSIWSKVNKDKVENLIASNRIVEAGLKSIETAKKNGSWTFLDSVEALEVPIDLENEFAKHKGSKEYYNSLSKSIQKGMLAWVKMAKRTETREKRILEIAENAAKHKKPKHFV